MSDGGRRRGWCPTANAPMESGDGWLVRARVGCRAVGSEQWRAVAAIAADLGGGRIELTARGNLQIRGLERRHTDLAAGRLERCGLAAADERSERRRLVVVDPLGTGSGDVVDRIEAAVAEAGGGLAPKWWAVVDRGGPWPVPSTGCDLALRRSADRWELVVAGRTMEAGDPLATALTLIERCAATGSRARDLPDQAPLPTDRSGVGAAVGAATPWWGLRILDGGRPALSAAPPLGVADVAAVEVLAEVAGAPTVGVHPTPQRGIVATADPGGEPHLSTAREALADLGWVVDADDPRRHLSACIGSPGCASGLVDTHRLAATLAVEHRTHISGCPKRCGAPGGVRELVATAHDHLEERR